MGRCTSFVRAGMVVAFVNSAGMFVLVDGQELRDRVIYGLQPTTGPATTVVLRHMNSLQARAAQTNGTFSGIAGLMQSGLPPVAGEPWWQVDPYSARSGRVTLRVLVSEDGKAYTASAQQEGTCEPSAFSDERGVIHEGRALGCDSAR